MSNELIKAVSLPDFMASYAGAGLENLEASDVETPRVKLIQGTSPELQTCDGLKIGHFYHSIANKSLGPKLRIALILVEKKLFLWNPRKSGGGVLARSDDMINWAPQQGEFQVKVNNKPVTWKLAPTVAASGLLEWGSSDPSDKKSPPAATEHHNMLVMLPDFPELSPAVLTLQRKFLKPAKNLYGQLKFSRGASFSYRFMMSSVDDSNAGQETFKNYSFMMDSMVDDAEEFKLYAKVYETFKGEGIKLKDYEENATVVAAPTGPVYDGCSDRDDEIPY